MRFCPSPNFDARSGPVRMCVLHYTGMQSAEAALARLCDPAAKVSAHYLVEEDGSIVQLVEEEARAWHAGVARWRGVTDVNGASIGIELVNPGHEWGYRPFTRDQIDALVPLVAEIVGTYGIEPANVVGHSDVAPARKQDPGELFPWGLLARVGLASRRPVKGLVDPGWDDGAFALALERWGYDIAEPEAATVAFQRRFRPELIDGMVDGECRAILMALLLARDGGSDMGG